MWVKITVDFVAGMLVGAGLCLFLVFLVSQLTSAVTVEGKARPILGGIGIVLLVLGGFLKLRLQRRSED
jgi:hypothetical protein